MKTMDNSPSAVELQDSLLGIVHPVTIYSGDEKYPYWGVGTAFTVEWRKHIYLISAKHIWVNQNTNPEHIRIFLRTGMEVRFDREAVMKDDYSPAGDLLVLRIYPEDLSTLSDNGLWWMDLGFTIGDSTPEREKNYCVCGYPDSDRSYDYDERVFSATMGILYGKSANSQAPGLDSLKLTGTGTPSLRGYSGSPVLRYANGQLEFSGMVVTGSGTSGVVNYIPAQAIAELLYDIEGMEYRHDYLTSE